jgi:DegV family protein with EDD domain
MGQGLLALMAAEQRSGGLALGEAAERLEIDRFHVCHWFTVADLGHLRRGGRISKTTAAVGTVLGIKPILHMDNEGRLVPVGKVRGRKKALEALVESMEQSAVEPAEQTAYITHADCLEDAEHLAGEIRHRLGVRDVVINYVGPIAGAHAGPSTLALFFIGKER